MDITQVVSEAIQVTPPGGSKPIVSFYYGVEGIKEVYLDTLKLPEEGVLYSFLGVQEIQPEIYKWLTTDYVKQRVDKKIFAHVFATREQNPEVTEEYAKKDEEENRKTYVVEAFEQSFKSEIIIYGDKIAFVNFHPDFPLVGIIIEHPLIAQTVKAFYLHYLWKS